jgi:hypothetical protein
MFGKPLRIKANLERQKMIFYDVIFKLPPNSTHDRGQTSVEVDSRLPHRVSTGRRRSFATQRMTSFINRNQVYIEFQDGASSSWMLPDRSDKAWIRAILDKVIEFAKKMALR